MSAKVAPSYNGNTSWFQYEELIDEWCDLTTVDPAKKGPNLKSRLFGEAQFLKALLEGNKKKGRFSKQCCPFWEGGANLANNLFLVEERPA